MPDVCRSCKALIRWAVSEADKAMPFDREPDDRGEWALAAGRAPGDPPRAVHVPAERRGSYAGSLYLPHFATCPHADQHRRR